MSDNRAIVYHEGDDIIFRASALGGAAKPMIALLMGFEPESPPPWLQKAFDFGHEHEDELRQEWLATHPVFELVDEQEEVELHVPHFATATGHAGNIIIRGHGDGIVRNKFTNELWVLELKWLGPDFYRAANDGTLFDKLPSYRGQIAFYSVAYGDAHGIGPMPVIYVCGDKDRYKKTGRVHFHEQYYEDTAVFLDQVDELFEVTKRVVEAAERGELPVECGCSGFCPTSYLHEDQVELVEDAEVAERIDRLAILHEDIKFQMSELEQQKKDVKNELNKLLATIGADKAETQVAKVTVVRQTMNGLDKEALARVVDLTAFQKPYTREYLRVTVKGVAE